MPKQQIDVYPLDDDAFDDASVSFPRPVRWRKSSSSTESQAPSLLQRPSYSSLFSFPEVDGADSPKLRIMRNSSSSSVPSGRLGSMSSISSLGASSTPSSTHEFVIPKRTTPPRPHTITSRGEILSQIDSSKLKGYHSVILREMRGGAMPKNRLERPVCRDITSFDFNFPSKDIPERLCDSLRGFEF